MTKTYRLAFLAFVTAAWLSLSMVGVASAAVEVSNRTPRQGDTVEIVLKSANSSSDVDGDLSAKRTYDLAEHTTVIFNGHKYKFFAVADSTRSGVASGASTQPASTDLFQYKALFAVPADLDPGKYPLKCGDDVVTLTVRAGVFPLQHIHLAPSKNNFDTAPGEEESVERAKSTVSADRAWTAPFTAPSKARTSTGFGLKRMVNGRLLKDYFHSGLDYAGALGSPILACSGGKIILVGRGFKLHGNTVAIDHGQGVVSFYIHMKAIQVAEGDVVKPGQQIGTVGQTGRATGPHLHFSIYVNKVAANPSNWFATTF